MSIARKYVTLHAAAQTPEELSILTIALQQTVWRMTLEFFDFQQNDQGEYICWYKVPLKQWQEAQRIDGEE